MQLSPTDLPEPVVPATSRCGIAARSATIGSPEIFLPRMIGNSAFDWANVSQATSSLKLTTLRSTLGNSMPITVRPGIEETRAEIALMLRAMSSASPTTRLALIPGAGSSSYIVTTGPVRTAVISPLTLKSSRTVSSSRALRSSASLSTLMPLSAGGSTSKSSDGRSNLSNRSPWRALGMPGRAGMAARAGSLISGGLRLGASALAAASAISLASRCLRALAVSRGNASGEDRLSPRFLAARLLLALCNDRGSVNKLIQSTANTRPASWPPPSRQNSAAAKIDQPCVSGGSNVAPFRIAPAPSKPAIPPIDAGKGPPGSVNTSDNTLDSNAIANNNIASGRHQRWCSVGALFSPSSPQFSLAVSSSASRHNFSAKTYNNGSNNTATGPNRNNTRSAAQAPGRPIQLATSPPAAVEGDGSVWW